VHSRASAAGDSDKANGLGLYYPVPLTNLQQGEDPDPDAPQPVPGRQADATPQAVARSALVLLFKIIVVCFAVYGLAHALFRFDYHADPHTPAAAAVPSTAPAAAKPAAAAARQSCNCGHSAAEAAALGCAFDPVAVAWLPAHCRDEALAVEFNAAGDWTDGRWLYVPVDAHLNATGREMSLADVAALPTGRFFASTMRWHVTHCAYVWLKQVRARHHGARAGPAAQLEKRFDTEEHVRHCLDVFLDRRPLEAMHLGLAVTTAADGEADTPVKGHWKTVKGKGKSGTAEEHTEAWAR